MNWTGGCLQRHCIPAGPAKTRQKQHFAKVRQNLRYPAKILSPVKWSTLDIYAGNRQFSPLHSSGIDLSQSLQLLKQDRCLGETHAIDVLHTSPDKEQENNVSNNVSNNMLYDFTSVKGKLEESTLKPLKKDETVAEKRRKMLRKGDWVGIKIRRPVEMKFTTPGHDENIGRRRTTTKFHGAKFRQPNFSMKCAFERKTHNFPGLISPERPMATNVRIKIGSKEISSDLSEKSVQNRKTAHSCTTGRRLETMSSDIMLLDNEAGRAQTMRASAKYEDSITTQNQNSGDEYFSRNRLELSREPQVHIYDVSKREELLPWLTSESRNGIENKLRRFGENNDRKYFSKLPSKKDQSPVRSWTDESDPLFFSSSSAFLRHPVPHSTKVSTLLRCSSSDLADRTTDWSGKVKPTGLDYHNLGVIMETYDITPLDEKRSDGKILTPGFQGFSIGPGGNKTIQVQPQPNKPSKRKFSAVQSEQDKYPKKCQKIETKMNFQSGLSSCNSSSIALPKSCSDSPLSSRSLNQEISREISPKKTQINQGPTMVNTTSCLGKQLAEAEDQDELWRNFVFGIDFDDSEKRAKNRS